MNHDEHDDLWQLLGKARPPRVSPFFSRNVLRAIREGQPERGPGWLGRLGWHWGRLSFATAVLAVLVMIGGVSMQSHRQQVAVVAATNAALDQAAHEVANSPDFPVIENLDTLLASDDNDVWLDPSLQ